MIGISDIITCLYKLEVHMNKKLGAVVSYCVQLEIMDDLCESYVTDEYIGADGRVHEPCETDGVPAQCRFKHLADAVAAYMTYRDGMGPIGLPFISAIDTDGTTVPVPRIF